eukprot:TRINITY_DN23744_c0_g1_i1.p1 TRINITY_DN23744_c0_g1~~TRINITY_DN23744_c0_g1_i1.p1  ORF type:complete len:291 (-),score=38.79 TRINITY_DN23744_c0_g1_i1:28-900(-)
MRRAALMLIWLAPLLSEAMGEERMQVIGAGLGRTSTNSMKMALERLGYRTMHMVEVFEGPEKHILKSAWSKFVTTPGVMGSNLEDLPSAPVDELLETHAKLGFNASVDWPIVNLYLHQLQRDPDAKVILTLRSSAEAWSESFMETIARATMISKRFPVNLIVPRFHELSKWMYESVGMTLDEETYMPTNPVEAYSAWAAKVRSTVPPEKLLVHEAKHGWKPLCDFLGVPVPDEPYPKAPNDREAMKKAFGFLEVLGKYFVVILTIVLIVLVAIGICCARICCATGKQKKS